MAGAEVIDRDLGYDRFISAIGEMGEPGVFVGILQDKGAEQTEDGGITVAGYAAVNEFGSEDGRVPERSFLRSTMDERLGEYQEALDEALGVAVDAMVQGGLGSARAAVDRHLGRLGAKASRDVKEKIRDLREPANAPSTLANKYPGDNPLIHTGRMRQSISFLVDWNSKASTESGAA